MGPHLEVTTFLINEWSRSVWLNSDEDEGQKPELQGSKALIRNVDFVLQDGELQTTFIQRKLCDHTWQGRGVGKQGTSIS